MIAAWYEVISVRWTRYSVPSVMSSLPGCEICSLRRRIFPLCSCGAWEERLVLWDTFLSGAGFHSRRWRRWISGSARGDHNKIRHHLPPLTWNQDQINPRTILQSSGISSLTFWQVLWCGRPGGMLLLSLICTGGSSLFQPRSTGCCRWWRHLWLTKCADAISISLLFSHPLEVFELVLQGKHLQKILRQWSDLGSTLVQFWIWICLWVLQPPLTRLSGNARSLSWSKSWEFHRGGRGRLTRSGAFDLAPPKKGHAKEKKSIRWKKALLQCSVEKHD